VSSCLGGVLVSVLALSVVDREFLSWWCNG
jgi:hypothetical protein